jgi:lipoprotein NlpD
MTSRQALKLLLYGCLCGCLCGWLVGCASNARAPVEDRNTRSPRAAPPPVSTSKSPYQVQRGDTLYSIAFRYGLDFRKVAAANRIPAPYTIYPGQRIYLFEAPLAVAAISAAATKTPVTRPATKPTRSPASKPRPPESKPPETKPATKPAPASAQAYTGVAVSKWRWPTNGSVTRRYSSNIHKGIDIGGKRGDSILAVAQGKGVYAGTGIVGFGELLIIKHNEEYLSAYGHNDRLLVREGQVVQAGQAIARKGSSGTDTVKLHFEIRKEGKPIDPQRLLPKR